MQPSYFSHAVVAHSIGGDNSGAGSPLLSLVIKGQLDTTQETGNKYLAVRSLNLSNFTHIKEPLTKHSTEYSKVRHPIPIQLVALINKSTDRKLMCN